MRTLQPWLVSGAVLLADQLSKHAVLHAFTPGESRPLLPPVLYLTFVQNTGAAFGLFKGWQLALIALTAGVAVWIARAFAVEREMPGLTRWGMALVLGGAVGNLIDRVRFGHVIDFLDLRVWPVFNLGDSAITVGVAFLLWQALRPRAPASR